MRYSIMGVLLFTASAMLEFQSPVALNLGISITFFLLMIAAPTAYSMWPDRLQHDPSERRLLNCCLMMVTCGAFNALLITIAMATSV